jgi:flavorubredoxin
MELNKYTRLTNLDFVMASHQDPDIITSMPRWLVYTEAKVVASKLWARFLPHLNSAFMSERMKGNWLDRLVELPDHGQVITLGQSSIIAVPAHFYIRWVIFSFMTQLPKFYFQAIWGHRWWTMPQNLWKTLLRIFLK